MPPLPLGNNPVFFSRRFALGVFWLFKTIQGRKDAGIINLKIPGNDPRLFCARSARIPPDRGNAPSSIGLSHWPETGFEDMCRSRIS